jgi:hypothetical protein
MSHWNHRVMRRNYVNSIGETETMLEIHEVYYGSDGKVTSYTENMIAPNHPEDGYGEAGTGKDGLECLRWELEQMLAALDKPVLDYAGETEGDAVLADERVKENQQ